MFKQCCWILLGVILLAGSSAWAQTLSDTAATPTITQKVDQLIESDKPAGLAKTKPTYQVESLFDSPVYAHGGFGGPSVRATQIDGKNACLVGGSGAWVVNHSFFLGGGGYGLTGPRIKRVFDNKERTLDFGYGGLILGWIAGSDQLLHASIQTLIGAGGIGFHQDVKLGADKHGDDIMEDQGVQDGFFVLEPMLSLELNVTDWFRIALGGGYRYIAGAEISDIRDKDLSGANAELMFKFGYF